jgi:hypothetical protein
LAFAFLAIGVNGAAAWFELRAMRENSGLIARVLVANEAVIAEGIPTAALPAAAHEAVRAGSKVFLFLAANVWLLWFYRAVVMRGRGEPLVPYLAACAVLAFVGWRLARAERAARDAGAGRPGPTR